MIYFLAFLLYAMLYVLTYLAAPYFCTIQIQEPIVYFVDKLIYGILIPKVRETSVKYLIS